MAKRNLAQAIALKDTVLTLADEAGMENFYSKKWNHLLHLPSMPADLHRAFVKLDMARDGASGISRILDRDAAHREDAEVNADVVYKPLEQNIASSLRTAREVLDFEVIVCLEEIEGYFRKRIAA